MHGCLSGTTETGGPAAPTNPRPIPAATRLGAVQLTVRDLERLREFYERALGLRATDRADGSLALSGEDGRTLVELHGDSAAPVRNIRHPGLFHQAILFPTRRDLALALARLAAVRWPLDGTSDHLVSEALYLSDPEGNGIELYRDRPREQWPHREGELQVATLPLDLDDLLGELRSGDTLPELVPPGTTIGHVHLQVSELRAAAAFFQGPLGFEVTVGDLPGALFLSAGGYHHHIGANTWNSAGNPPPPAGAAGLRAYEIVLPDDAEVERALASAVTAGITLEHDDHGALVRDPAGIAVRLRSG